MMEKIKKVSCFLLALCMVFLLAACDSGGGSDNDDIDLANDPFPAIVVDPYLPADFAGLNGSLYKSDLEIEEEVIAGVTYVTKELTCVYLFDNLSFVSSSTKIYIKKSTGTVDEAKTEKEPEAKGTYTLTGNKTNGTLNVSRTHEWEDDPAPGHWEADPETKNNISISGGVFTITESGMSIRFTLFN